MQLLLLLVRACANKVQCPPRLHVALDSLYLPFTGIFLVLNCLSVHSTSLLVLNRVIIIIFILMILSPKNYKIIGPHCMLISSNVYFIVWLTGFESLFLCWIHCHRNTRVEMAAMKGLIKDGKCEGGGNGIGRMCGTV